MTVHKRLRMERHAGVSLECRGVLAHHERRLDELIVYSSTQFPHVIRTMLAQAVGLSETQLGVIAPDVGGVFGIKNNFNPEEIAVTALALKLGKPLRWIEDRREHLIASPHAREHRYELTAHADERGPHPGARGDRHGRCRGLFGLAVDRGDGGRHVAGIMTGPYDIPVYHGRAITVCTNKSPLGPYRGVGRQRRRFAIEP